MQYLTKRNRNLTGNINYFFDSFISLYSNLMSKIFNSMKTLLFTAVLAIIALSSCNKGETLSGAGATFPAPFYNVVFKDFSNTSGTRVSYGGIGSGGGIRSLQDKTVDFGATDVFLSDNEKREMGAEVLHIPTAIGGIVLSYNLPGVEGLRLTHELISNIYKGIITNWNDPKLQEVNPNVSLPDKKITPVFRSDGSGTTAVFTEYLTKVNSDWANSIGEGKSINFPAGIAAKGNPGVAGIIVGTEGSIGYIGSEFALALNMATAVLQNSSGNFVAANTQSISLSANIDIPVDTRVVITNSPDPNAYPISTFTWILVYREQSYNNRSEARAQNLKALLKHVISPQGQEMAARTHYAPLPAVAVQRAQALLESMTFEGRPIN
jgi:phosphate transport system substrate-binding protein